MKYVKNQIYNTHYVSSTLPKGTMAELGTIEKDACSYYGRHDTKPFDGYNILEYSLSNLDFHTVLDVGSGECKQADYLIEKGKEVSTCDFGDINGAHCSTEKKYDYEGDFLEIDFKDKKFDFVFTSHVLEHQRNVGLFLDKIKSVTRVGGYICIAVPIRKPFITGGHLTLWNPGLLLYNLVASGIDCSESYVLQKDYDIGLAVKYKPFNIEMEGITYDRGDVDLLSKYFPLEVKEPFNGDIMLVDTLSKESRN